MCLYCDVGVLDERLVDQNQEMVFVEEKKKVVVVCCCDCDEQARGLKQEEEEFHKDLQECHQQVHQDYSCQWKRLS